MTAVTVSKLRILAPQVKGVRQASRIEKLIGLAALSVEPSGGQFVGPDPAPVVESFQEPAPAVEASTRSATESPTFSVPNAASVGLESINQGSYRGPSKPASLPRLGMGLGITMPLGMPSELGLKIPEVAGVTRPHLARIRIRNTGRQQIRARQDQWGGKLV